MDAATSTPVAAPAAPVAAPAPSIVAQPPAGPRYVDQAGRDVTGDVSTLMAKTLNKEVFEEHLQRAGITKTGSIEAAKTAAVESAAPAPSGLSFGPLGMSKEEVSAVTSKLDLTRPGVKEAIEKDAAARGWTVDTRTPQEIEHDRAFPRPNSAREYGITNGDLAGALHALDIPIGIGRSLANDMQSTAAKLSGMSEGQIEAWEHQQMLDLGPDGEKLQSQARWVLGRLDPAQRQRLWPDSGRVSAQTVLLLAQAAQRFHARAKGYF